MVLSVAWSEFLFCWGCRSNCRGGQAIHHSSGKLTLSVAFTTMDLSSPNTLSAGLPSKSHPGLLLLSLSSGSLQLNHQTTPPVPLEAFPSFSNFRAQVDAHLNMFVQSRICPAFSTILLGRGAPEMIQKRGKGIEGLQDYVLTQGSCIDCMNYA